jgi:malonate transporter MadL subunit
MMQPAITRPARAKRIDMNEGLVIGRFCGRRLRIVQWHRHHWTQHRAIADAGLHGTTSPFTGVAMVFYGTALLAACLIAGLAIGQLIGTALGVDSDIGGVGIAMLLLIGSTSWLSRRGLWSASFAPGVQYWGDIYIPIVVAMAATQNVRGAWAGGVLALVAGFASVALAFATVALLIRRFRYNPATAAPQDLP